MITKPLFKTTIVIWTDWDPTGDDIEALAFDAMIGNAFSSVKEMVKVEDPTQDPMFPETEYGMYEEEQCEPTK